ncbi:PPOX class F420-dependent oxidoreductase [Agrococcus sp. ARC_14]|uniref:PPOX class F420-dependent oxidoreductase n=1 Tax=Agrococcus sp. ARC_14 TaxID=2919927 RepID=UPI001F0707AB|nr:PPOX class F420-dependent oxidoreductase [Agrococcus sp. ARC_14]MCH1881529.1 PPOX class F420-dependent oxidoreductase [Agrococcus sp. ARC_14]
MATIPEQYRYLLEQPLFAHLATLRPDGTPQVNPMWFGYDGEHLLFTHTNTRQKFKNLQANPAMAVSMTDPEKPYLYVEVRGHLAEVIDDPTGAYYVELQQRYGSTSATPPPDAASRVILKMAVDKVSGRVETPQHLE